MDCPVKDCKGRRSPLDTIRGTEFQKLDIIDGNGVHTFSRYGVKIEQLLGLVRVIKDQNDRALLFVQEKKAIQKIEAAFKENGLKCDTLGESSGAGNVLREFQSGNSSATVLILNIGNASAAGSNITAANHVIFFTPYLTEGPDAQTIYDDSIAQAIGRAKRFGQKKNVCIYHLLTSKTFDVDLHEERNRMVVEENQENGERARRVGETRLSETPNCSHLFRMVLGRNQG